MIYIFLLQLFFFVDMHMMVSEPEKVRKVIY